MKILVIQQKMIGDVLMSSILFEPLKKKYPNAEVHYILNSHTYPVVQEHPFIDKFIFVTPEINASKKLLFNFSKALKKEKYDVVIDAYGKISSLLMTVFSGAKVKIGYEKYYTKLLYSNSIKRHKKSIHNTTLAIENRMLLLEPLDVLYEPVTAKINLLDSEINSAKQFLEEGGVSLDKPLFMISVLGSGMQKTYPFEYMAKLLDAVVLQIPDAQLLFNYIPSQKEQAKQIFDFCTEQTKNQIKFDVFGKSLRQFIAITHFCNAMIGNEGGAVNMAKALSKPCFVIFSPQINKIGWFNEQEYKQTAVHLSDFVTHGKEERDLAKKDSTPFYKKLTPDLILPELNNFLKSIL